MAELDAKLPGKNQIKRLFPFLADVQQALISLNAIESHAHDDILFAAQDAQNPVTQVRMKRGPQEEIFIENFEPSAYLNILLTCP